MSTGRHPSLEIAQQVISLLQWQGFSIREYEIEDRLNAAPLLTLKVYLLPREDPFAKQCTCF